jgi:hypothetical protein
MKLTEILLPPLCVLLIFTLRILSLFPASLPGNQNRPQGNNKNEKFGIQELPKITNKKFLISCVTDLYSIETTENTSVNSVVPYLILFS